MKQPIDSPVEAGLKILLNTTPLLFVALLLNYIFHEEPFVTSVAFWRACVSAVLPSLILTIKTSCFVMIVSIVIGSVFRSAGDRAAWDRLCGTGISATSIAATLLALLVFKNDVSFEIDLLSKIAIKTTVYVCITLLVLWNTHSICLQWRRRRVRLGYCNKCGYPCQNFDICPECGTRCTADLE